MHYGYFALRDTDVSIRPYWGIRKKPQHPLQESRGAASRQVARRSTCHEQPSLETIALGTVCPAHSPNIVCRGFGGRDTDVNRACPRASDANYCLWR